MDREPDDGGVALPARERRRGQPRCRGRSASTRVTAWLGYRARSGVAVGRASAARVVGAIIYAGGGGGAWVLLLATLRRARRSRRVSARARRTSLGIAEERGGRRGAGNAIANCGVAAVAAVAAAPRRHTDGSALLALVAALTAGGSDTVASEIGKAWGRSTFLVTTLGRVKPGTPGAMSLEGTAAGLRRARSRSRRIGVGARARSRLARLSAVVVGATAGALRRERLARRSKDRVS